MRIKIKTIIAGLLIVLSIGQAIAKAATGSTKATATLAGVCTVSASDISFGDVTAKTTSDAAWTTSNPVAFNLNVLCSNKLAYKIALNVGIHASGTTNYLLGAKSGDKIQYILCKGVGFTSANGTCSSGQWAPSLYHSDTGTGAVQAMASAAYIKKGFYTPDSYSDTVTATVTF